MNNKMLNKRQQHSIELFDKWLNSEEYQKKIENRLKIQEACEKKSGQILSYQLAQKDILFWINNFVWFADPRPEYKIHNLPAILFDYQEEFALWLRNKIDKGEDGLVEKSRDVGATWLFVVVFVWYWLFSDSFSGLMGSYKEVWVDNRTLDSLFGKIDYIIRNLPKWMLPKRFDFGRNRQKMKLVNPENYNVITGDTMNSDFGRGSRKSAIFLDEGAFWEYFQDAWMAAGDSTSCRLTVSTSNGKNAFYLLRQSGMIDVKTLHWTMHPFKDQEWYEYEKERRSEEEIAKELDISYVGSQAGRVYPEWDKVEWGDYPYNPDFPLYVSWDFGKRDDTAIIWYQSQPDGRVRIIDAYSKSQKLIDFYVPFITGIAPSDPQYTKRELEIIESHSSWKSAVHFGDPAGRFTSQVINTSVIDILKEYGIKVYFREEAKDFATRKSQTKLLLRKLVVNKIYNTELLGTAIESSHYPSVTKNGLREIDSIKPVHDWSAHFRSSLEYFAVNYDAYKGNTNRRIVDKFSYGSKKRVGY